MVAPGCVCPCAFVAKSLSVALRNEHAALALLSCARSRAFQVYLPSAYTLYW